MKDKATAQPTQGQDEFLNIFSQLILFFNWVKKYPKNLAFQRWL
jgi:hypothetical protein